ncbi:glycosyltransferase family 39 protein [Trinickia terrae]|uniref:Glycosyltransferase family 39 protein n=1 Tax=Trinickia terrae TaxID=2571161 RepID=A0A4U1I0P0_9BURK|nr:glycosyltransferase family 39 protein [Trinickia terrae]TKC86691.1 glycosyltransferase family 39 protein [Trinickia terrae]
MSDPVSSYYPGSEPSTARADEPSLAAPLALLLPIHALVWTFAAWLSRGNLDVQGDMIENYVWGAEWQAGYAKHPPLFAWITAAWFEVFPHTDFAYFGLSAVNALAGLLGIVALAGRFLPRRLAIAAGLAMAVSPLYSNLAIKFNANSVLLSVWPWTAYFFVRYMQTGKRSAALALGALAALAILGKYFSIVLLVALLGAALARPQWRARLLSVDSLLVAAAGAVVLFPHLRWLVLHHFPTFGYAERRTGGTLPAAALRFGVYTLAQAGYMLLSFGFVVGLVARDRLHAAKLILLSHVRPSLHRDLWCLAIGPLMVVGVIAVGSKTQMASVWGMAQWFALVPLWVAVLDRAAVRLEPGRAARMLCIYWALALAASAAVGYAGATRNTDDAAEPRAELAAAVHALWRERTGQALPIAAGSVHEAQSVGFYSDGQTRFWDIAEPETTPWLKAEDLARQGAVLVCPNSDAACVRKAASFSHVQPISIDVAKKAWGMVLPARGYQLFLMMPQQG